MNVESFTIDDTEIVSSESPDAIRQSFALTDDAPPSDAPTDPAASEASGTVPPESAVEASEDEAPTPLVQEPGEPKSSYQKRVKERDSFHERIGELTKKRRAAEERAEQAERRAAELEARLRQPGPEMPQAPRQPAAPQARPAEGEPKFEDFQNEPDPYQAWLDARTEWRVTAALKAERERIASEREAEKFQQRMAAARAKHPDFDRIAMNPQTVASNLMLHVCRTTEDGLDLAYFLGSHPDEARRIAYLPDQEQLLELGAIRVSLRSASAPPSVAAGTASGAAPVTKAKPPVQPVRSGPVATDEPPGDGASDDEHVRYWNSKEGLRTRR